ncbi:hypothetical protein MGSAQ_002647 [marine sediment metagenome]|uniref:Uncharacterized protein n=1 Tax=marine sediment metagenome TaxID=412755 RepID=A0A1B6NQV9_9ZZZZ
MFFIDVSVAFNCLKTFRKHVSLQGGLGHLFLCYF